MIEIPNVVLGWICIIGSIISFGSFAVAIKTKSVIDAKIDPVVFQGYKTFWAFITSFIAFIYNPFSFTPWGIFSGLFWVPGGIAAVISVPIIGMGVAQGIWSGLIIIISFLWGTIIFKESLRNLPLSILAVILLLLGVIGMAISPLLFKPKENNSINNNDTDNSETSFLIKQTSINYNTTGDNKDINIQKNNDNNMICPSCCSIKKKIIGYLAASFCGLWGGSIMTPLKFAEKEGIPASGIQFVFSFACGAAIVNISIYILYSIYRIIFLKLSAPPLQFKVMFFPGMFAGILWSTGNYLSIYAVIFLGQAIAYPCVQASLLVSGLWGIFYYKELRSYQIVVWFFSACLVLGALGILSQMHT